MARITGIGGILLQSSREEGLRSLLTTLGVPLEPWGTFFPWREREDPEKKGYTVLGLFAQETDYFGPDQSFMVNFRVDDLEEALTALEAAGHEVVKRMEEPNGRFAHVVAPGGMRVELWQPAALDPYDE